MKQKIDEFVILMNEGKGGSKNSWKNVLTSFLERFKGLIPRSFFTSKEHSYSSG